MNANMTIENGKLVFGRRECSNCWGTGLVAKRIDCPSCKGTGNGKRGGKGQCKACNGFKNAYDHVNKVTCGECNGVDSATAEQADRYDYLPEAIWKGFEFRVYRTTARQTWNQAYLGLGSIFSVTDYGRSKNISDAELVDHVRNATHTHQASKVSKEDGTVATFIAIVTNDNGYTVVPSFEVL